MWVEAEYAYEKRFAETMSALQQQDPGRRVTVLKEETKARCLEEYRAMREAETVKKKYRLFVDGGLERINSIKALMRVNQRDMS